MTAVPGFASQVSYRAKVPPQLQPVLSDAQTIMVTESYEHSGVGGRISKVTTAVAVGGSPRFEYALGYDPLGAVTSRTYPRCTHSFCSQADVARTITATYTHGLLTAVPGYASALTYHPNGLLDQVAHTKGVTDTQERDPNDMARPLRLRTSGASGEFDSWLYAFDGHRGSRGRVRGHGELRRHQLGSNRSGVGHTINEESGAYLTGQVAGFAHGVALGGVGAARVAGVQTKLAIHGAHHAFPRLGGRRLAHIQLNLWRTGVKGSGKAFRIALPWR